VEKTGGLGRHLTTLAHPRCRGVIITVYFNTSANWQFTRDTHTHCDVRCKRHSATTSAGSQPCATTHGITRCLMCTPSFSVPLCARLWHRLFLHTLTCTHPNASFKSESERARISTSTFVHVLYTHVLCVKSSQPPSFGRHLKRGGHAVR
jgi:hypothetical protein